MKRIYNYILMSALAFVAGGCINEEFNNDIPTAESGDEVQFGLSLPDAKTRTVYGDEDEDTENKAFPIYWVNEDKVQIFSPQCLEGRRNAEYKVAVDGSEQNYATSLTKTGAYGVQWGDEETADFYSLYPSGNYTLSDDGTKAEGITINYSQNILVDGDDVKSDMEDCLMYAKTTGVTRGETVNLHYDPISTVFMVTLNVPDDSADDFTIQSISLIADNESIAGTFSLDIADGSFAEWSDNSSSTVTAQIYDKSTGGYYTLTKGNSVQIPLFLAPVEDLNTYNWLIKVVANNKEYSKTLDSQDIVAGEIHKVNLPNLSTDKKEEEWDVSKWITYIPRNVYLSEVSIPGSWNSINPDFQTVASTDAQTIANQYSQGVRAFHLDTRWKAKYSLGGYGPFQSVIGLGVADGGDNGNSWSGTITSGDKYMRGDDVPLVSDIIAQLVSYIQDTPDEYMVLVCSFAQESIDHEGTNGKWYGEISAICNDSQYTDYIMNAQDLSANTLVGDVLGKILVIVNMPAAISAATDLPTDSKCMFTYMPSELSSDKFTSGSELKNNTNSLWNSKKETNITLYNNQAQITSSTTTGITHDRGYAPTITERSNVLNSFLDWSRKNYGTENYKHDKWLYLGLGGYQVSEGGNAGAVSGSYSTIASTYNGWINGKVTEMGTIPNGATETVPYYPVGIVLMNFVDSYKNSVKNILTLNNKYRLQYDPSKPTDYVGSNVDTGGNGGGTLPD